MNHLDIIVITIQKKVNRERSHMSKCPYVHMNMCTYMDMWTFRHIWTYGHLDTYGHMDIIEKDNSSSYSWRIFSYYMLYFLYLCRYMFCPFIPFVVILFVPL